MSRPENCGGSSCSGDAGDQQGVKLARVAASGLVRRSRYDTMVEAGPISIEGSALPTVLLVDENRLLVRSLARWFGRFGCTVTAAFTWSEAAAVSGAFDCGVFEVDVGARDGVALADGLLSSGTIWTAAFYCASTDGRVLRRALERGPVVFKDAPMLQLMQAVRAQLEVARSARIVAAREHL